jgi:accessory colonization factor AcfC
MFLRSLFRIAIFVGLLGAALPVSASTPTLRVYGPGGPHHVLEECAEIFEQRHGIAVVVAKARPDTLADQIRSDGDIYYGGAEYMLYEFDRLNPGVLDTESTELLHPRRVGIVVRKGNPRNIRGPEDLQRQGLDLIDVKLENMRRFHGSGDKINSNIRRFVFTGQDGVAAWRRHPEVDAWVTYRSWHRLLDAEADFIEIPGAAALRYIPVAVTRHTPRREAALTFIDFLQSAEARAIFLDHGWD